MRSCTSSCGVAVSGQCKMISYVWACLPRGGLRVGGFIEFAIFCDVNKLTEQLAIYLMVIVS
jgi:hypothetical protein